MTKPHLQSEKIFLIDIKGEKKLVRPVDGEDYFDEPGLSHGFVHCADPKTGEKLGFCGLTYFDTHAIEVTD